jgi:transposase-like protein
MTPRKMYSIEFKKSILAEAAAENYLSEVCRRHNIDLRMARRWWKQASLGENGEGDAPARIKGAGRKMVLGDLENVVLGGGNRSPSPIRSPRASIGMFFWAKP